MLKLNHKYVVRLYGVATQQEPIMIAMELCPGGSLRERIDKKDSPLSGPNMRKYCKQIAKGMRYLERKQVRVAFLEIGEQATPLFASQFWDGTNVLHRWQKPIKTGVF
uniref:Protein kinase domain-containing protein n=1 Tax=Caenorhabditis japonica TaxID=281687 RepID=A0A8R1IM83_CAEJA